MTNKLTLQELKSHLWESANLLRGSIDSSDFKNYIFGLPADFGEGHSEFAKVDGDEPYNLSLNLPKSVFGNLIIYNTIC